MGSSSTSYLWKCFCKETTLVGKDQGNNHKTPCCNKVIGYENIFKRGRVSAWGPDQKESQVWYQQVYTKTKCLGIYIPTLESLIQVYISDLKVTDSGSTLRKTSKAVFEYEK